MSGNAYHDVAAQEGGIDLGVDALHGLAPDELLMRAEEEAAEQGREQSLREARCLLSLLTAITWQVVNIVQIRDRLAWVTAAWAPDLVNGEDLWHGHVEWRLVREQVALCPAVAWQAEAGRVMIGLLTANGWTPREVGLRALCLLYAFQPAKAARPVIAGSFARIGEAIGLQAENKRSAVSAAMQRIVIELLHRMERVTKTRGTGEFWFNKRAGCKSALSAAMQGKKNRLKKGEKNV